MTPDEHTNEEFFLDVGDGYRLYVHDWGNPKAKIPIVFLHGGPGNGCADKDKTKFEPQTQRIIFHDQRGAGQSIPRGSLENNSTDKLVEDIEKIAQHLKLDKFVITGGSWGSFLALVYGIKHSERLAGMVIQGIFTGSHDEIDWLEKGRFQDFFPDSWERYLQTVPKAHQNNPTAYHFKRALGNDYEAAKASAYAYQLLEQSLLKLDDRFLPPDYETYEPDKIRSEIHYVAHHCFVPDNYIFKNVAKLTMPVWLVQGRYDMVCRPQTAYKLHKELPNSELIWTVDGHVAGHEASNILKLANRYLAGAL